jgi:hypothetical protein
MVLVVVFMVRVEVPPPPVVDAGLKPAVVTRGGYPDSLLALGVTVPVNPLRGLTVTVKLFDCPGLTACADGLTAMSKSGLDGRTVMVRVGEEGSELPLPSIRVKDAT